MQTLFEVGFVLALIVPTAAVLLCAGALLTSSFVHRRAQRPALGVEVRREAALHH